MKKLFTALDFILFPIIVVKNDEIIFFNSYIKDELDLDKDIDSSYLKLQQLKEQLKNLKNNFFEKVFILEKFYEKIIIPIKSNINIYIFIPSIQINENIKINNISNESIFQLFIDNVPEIMFFKNTDLKYVIVNKKCKEFYAQFGIDNIINKTDMELPLDEQFLKRCFESDKIVLDTKKSIYIEEKFLKEDKDEFYIYQTIKNPVIDKNGKIHGLIGSARDVTENKKIEEKLRFLNKELEEKTKIDPLTGLYNKRYLEKIKFGFINLDTETSAIMIDIDYFKLYNDNYGHILGDNVLLSVSNIIKKVFYKDFVFRYGGEEFLVISLLEKEILLKKLDYLFELIHNEKIIHKYSKISEQITISAGIYSQIIKNVMEVEILINEADKRLYKAKRSGRDRYKS